uniref:Cell cycle associated protein 1b n=1 Tax=Oryzias sinensis TaxID=183150 RepID=A0A8C7XNE0_9TELE
MLSQWWVLTSSAMMPSATNANTPVQSASPEVGSAPGLMGSFAQGGQSEVLKQVLCIIDKKVRNMEKKKSKLDDYSVKKNKGEGLNQDQLEALSKYQEVMNNLEFARELQKTFITLGQDIQKVVKKSARREQLVREEAEQRRLKTVLEVQFILDRLGDSAVRQDLKQGVCGSTLLTDEDLAAFDEFYKLVGPERDQNVRLTDQFDDASVHLWDLLEGKDKAVVGTTYKALKETLDQVLLSGYFDRIPSHQNGLCEEEEEEEEEVLEEEPVTNTTAVTGTEASEAEEQIVVEGLLFFLNCASFNVLNVSRRKAIEDQFKDSSDFTETEVVGALQQQQPPLQPAVPPGSLETHPIDLSSPVPPSDPMVRKQVVQDLMAQMQGPYNFMQDSMLEYDGQPIDPAIVSAQPMKPAQNMEAPQMVCPPVHPESRLSQSNSVPVQPEPTQVSGFIRSSSHAQEPRLSPEVIEPIQTSMSLSTEQPPPSTALAPASQTQGFPAVSKPPHSSGINVNAAPFQSMQTVFNLNAPVPPANEAEALNHANQYQNSYNQAFSSQPQHPAEPAEMPSEQLQSDPSAGHQQPVQQGPGFGRQTQSFYNSRGMPRGGPRNARGLINGYRGSSNGFRGGYDGYRPPFNNSPNSGYGQTQFSTPRDYSNGNYQRDGYQQNYKRGTGQGPRGMSRGSTQAMRS